MIPLCVDLDGTLIDSDVTQESFLRFLQSNPLRVLGLPVWLAAGGRVRLKAQIVQHVEVDAASLPYNAEVLALIKAERAKGRQIVLATASHMRYAQQVADHLKLFDQVIGTESVNLNAQRKADRLVAEFGEKGFDYMGNSHDDLVVWRHARQAYVVNASARVRLKAQGQGNVAGVLDTRTPSWAAWVRAMRFHQWAKNLLVFAPLLAAHQYQDPALLLLCLLAFLVFSLCASSVYLFNDLLDIQDDRLHASKRKRPFAAGQLSVPKGLFASLLLLLGAFAASTAWLPYWFNVTLAAYFGLTLGYSMGLKRLVVADVVVLGMLYTLRIVAGAFLLTMPPTFWILAFSMFLFLSLALVKRCAELMDITQKGQEGKAHGRGYISSDLGMLWSLGAASGYLAVMVLALYIQDQRTVQLYEHPQRIWLTCPLMLYWVSRIWMITHRGQMHEDPVVFAIKDMQSWLIALCMGLIVWAAR